MSASDASGDAAERLVGRAVIEAMRRSARAKDIVKKMLGDLEVSGMDDESALVDLIDEQEMIVAFINLPGADKESIDLKVAEDTLSVAAEVPGREGSYLRRERSRRFRVDVKLPVEIKPEQVKAKFENGVLEVQLPKLVVILTQKVEIE